MGGTCSLERFPKKPPGAEQYELRTKLIIVMTSLRCYDNFDAKMTLVITNFHLYLIQLW